MRYDSKEAFLADVTEEHDSFCTKINSIDPARWEEPDVWGDGWNLKDLVAHLAEWQRMFLGWHKTGIEGRKPEMPAPGFKWNETPRLNRAIREKHAPKPRQAVIEDFDAGYKEILALLEDLSPAELLEPGHFEWTGKYPLTTYLGPNTASHFRFANKVVDRWLCRS
ncbi:MAG: ClbS/DfsB family four-helix bundle protein [Aridibacter famidurans]|nr:ClbS/DfsB family four-helix bundle protein [Aridibacter famidurans]